MRISDIIEHGASKYGDSTAAIHSDKKVNYSELYRASIAVAEFLEKLGISKSARIALMFENSFEYIYLYFAIFRAGFVAVPLDTSLKPEMLNFILSDCGAEVLIFQSRYRRHLPEVLSKGTPVKHVITDKLPGIEFPGVEFSILSDILKGQQGASSEEFDDKKSYDPGQSPHELAAIFYTSGSTGTPKGVMLSHRNLISNTYATIEYLRLRPGESVIVILPFYYIYGNSLLLTHLACGGTVVIDNRFMYPEVILDTMEKENVTGFSGVPSNFMILLNKSTFPERKFKGLRYFTQAGGSMAPEVIKKLMKAFPDKEIYIMYGQTEASPRVTYLPPERLKDKIGSIGIPVPRVDVRVMNDDGIEVAVGKSGELTVAGDCVMLGYWNQGEQENNVIRDGRLYTGDLARKDEEGYLYIIGRKKEIIKTGGNRVSAKEIEERILEHENVTEAAVFGIKDDILGEAVKAVIVPRDGADLKKKDIQNFCRAKLADHKVPKYIEFMATLPKYQSGKVDKVQLAKM